MPFSRRQDLIRALPYARRYARALTGSQSRGDLLVAESLRELAVVDTGALPARLSLYRWISRHFDATAMPAEAAAPTDRGGSMGATERKLLLLTSLEEVPLADAARTLDIDPRQATDILSRAHASLRTVAETNILIIEDEPIIAMDIEDLVRRCGHQVAGVAATEADAVALATRTRPGLILADINLGAGGDGMRAVASILRHHDTPVIFVTAYPERLLTGETVEPAFVITKPFEPMTLAIATYQAVTGGPRIG
ncbi:response regulator [Gluconacetobacter azotocaptans]|uniref:Response regulator n=1 Tax=Gluconacetobacter azotocaptans TaxID=142834 RepID=A0A7W4PH26_9PROT|nr:response regulator [Gluconacetobacter azotocaptans]MBB2190636.1 response regulator [Gluconacetobacter azotocaptans]MBM9400968.1 response regulator [Gluconacetobacter azotocaptans]GBQ26674.1 two-component response regulator [Gluconacetobacter azotocaptans DSM 13594]